MSTAAAPVRCSARRRSPSTRRWLEAIGAMRTRSPPRRSTPARIVGSSHTVVPVGPRSSLASTTSPGSRSGSSAPQKPAISTARPRGAVGQREPTGRRAAAPSRSGAPGPRAPRRGPRAPRPRAAPARDSVPGDSRAAVDSSCAAPPPARRSGRIGASSGAGRAPAAWRPRPARMPGGLMAAAHRALHRRRPAGVGPRAGQHQSRQPGAGRGRQRPGPGAARNVAACSRVTKKFSTAASRGAGQAARPARAGSGPGARPTWHPSSCVGGRQGDHQVLA